MSKNWIYHKGSYMCPTPKCHYIATMEYIKKNSTKVICDRSLNCPRCKNTYLLGYIGGYNGK